MRKIDSSARQRKADKVFSKDLVCAHACLVQTQSKRKFSAGLHAKQFLRLRADKHDSLQAATDFELEVDHKLAMNKRDRKKRERQRDIAIMRGVSKPGSSP